MRQHSSNKWLCLTISTAFKHGNITATEQEIRKIFGTDLREAKIVCNAALLQSGGYYCMLLCNNYLDHISTLKMYAPDIVVLESPENPRYLSTGEVRDFVKSSENVGLRPIRCGDIVVILDGYLKNLYGLVSGHSGKRHCVSFKTHLRTFTEIIASKSLNVIGNCFQRKKFPVLRQLEGVDEHGHNKYGETHRECFKSKAHRSG